MTWFVIRNRSGVFWWNGFFLEKAGVLPPNIFTGEIAVPVNDEENKKAVIDFLHACWESGDFWKRCSKEGLHGKQPESKGVPHDVAKSLARYEPQLPEFDSAVRSGCLQAPIFSSQPIGTAH